MAVSSEQPKFQEPLPRKKKSRREVLKEANVAAQGDGFGGLILRGTISSRGRPTCRKVYTQ